MSSEQSPVLDQQQQPAQYQSPVPDSAVYSPASTTNSDYRSAQSTPNYPQDYQNMSNRSYQEPSRYPPNSTTATTAQAVPASYPQAHHQLPAGTYAHDMAHAAAYPPQQAPVWRDWSNQAHYPYGHPSSSHVSAAGIPAAAMPARPMEKVYSFVPIPGAQQHKRPRRRYEEIERMYKCGWNGCEKAYGTLNHLNAHVTMQSHGVKRTPEEFKEIRKEWKARKKEEEAQKKAAQERERERLAQEAANGAASDHTQQGQAGQAASQALQQRGVQQAYGNMPRQLPPISYSNPPTSAAYTAPSGLDQVPQFQAAGIYAGYPQTTAYGHSQQMYANAAPAPQGVAAVPTSRVPQAQQSTEEADGEAEAENDVNSNNVNYTA